MRCVLKYIGIVKQNKEMLIDDMKLLIRYEKNISNIDGLVVMIMVKNCKECQFY